MALTAGRAALKAFLIAATNNTDQNKTAEESADELIDALEAYIKTAQLNVPGTGLISPSGAITGTSITGTLE